MTVVKWRAPCKAALAEGLPPFLITKISNNENNNNDNNNNNLY